MSQFDSYDEVEMCDYEENVTSTLFLFYLDGEYIGYVIVDKETNNICEISENVPTYYLYMSNNGYSKLNPSGWERMVSEVEVLFNKNYANNSVPSVIKEYVKKYSRAHDDVLWVCETRFKFVYDGLGRWTFIFNSI